MPLDSRFIIASDLASQFFDKDTGLPLAGGVITFYKDQARTDPKDVFQLSGSPPNYSYVSLGNQITLSATGLMQNEDTGQIIILYYEPFDDSGKVELYYVTCYNADGVLQWTREGWPNYTVDGSANADVTNFAPNGQFLLHNTVPATSSNNYIAGKVTQPVTPLAQGGWTFERPNSSTATDIITFEPFVSAVSVPAANPKNALRIQCQSPSAGDAYKDVRLTFNDVNKFASDTQKFTYALSGQSNSGGSISATLILRKNFGTSGSTPTETNIATVTIPNGSYGIISSGGFIFGTNIGKTIGPDGDDNVQLILRLPTNNVFDISVTNFELLEGAVTVTDFPPTPDSKFIYQSVVAALPNPDGSDLFLKPVLTPLGMKWDDSCIGDVVTESHPGAYINSLHPTSNRLLPDGSQYETAGYSPLGVPFARLQAKYWDTNINVPMYGTGANYLTANLSDLSPTTELRIATNKRGAATNIADGPTGHATGFTFATPHTGGDYGITAYRAGDNTLLAIGDTVGQVPPVQAQTTGFTIVEVLNQSNRKHIFTVATVEAAGLAGTYWTWNEPAAAYYMWFTVDGAGADPAPAGFTGIKVDLLSTYTAKEVACFVLEAMSGYQISTVITAAASTLTAGDYFTVNTANTGYYVWYTVDGAGTDPAPTGKVAIPVAVLSADTAAQVATKTQIAINSKYFAVPNFQGLFLRSYDPNRTWDADALSRFGATTAYYGNEIGTLELDSFLSHTHQYTKVQGSGSIVQGGSTFADNISEDTTAAGGNETRAVNASVNLAIIY